MSLMHKKYKKLVKELLFVNSEHEYVNAVLKEAHIEFEKQYRQYCAENDVPVDDLNKNNKDMLKEVFPKHKPKVDKEGLVKPDKKHTSKTPADKVLQKMYRAVASKIHPDKFSTFEETPDVLEKIEMFKSATTAYNERKWGKFLDICDKLDILPNRYTKIMDIIQAEINNLNNTIKNKKTTFSWRLYECDENDECKEAIFRNFLFQLFKYEA